MPMREWSKIQEVLYAGYLAISAYPSNGEVGTGHDSLIDDLPQRALTTTRRCKADLKLEIAMPLRDHFRPPVSKTVSWEGFLAGWPTTVIQRLVEQLPGEYAAEPRVRLGTNFEADWSFQRAAISDQCGGNGGAGTAFWAPPAPTLAVDADPTEQYAYEVLIFDQSHERVLVAAIEFVSPGNKDRPQSRREFVAKCAALLTQGVCVSIIDVVTTRHFNLYADLLDLIAVSDPAIGNSPPATYAVTCRGRKVNGTPRFESWAYPLPVGQPLPMLPLWLTEELAISLDLEGSYEDACRTLRIAAQ
jgi:hypothetical protein